MPLDNMPSNNMPSNDMPSNDMPSNDMPSNDMRSPATAQAEDQAQSQQENRCPSATLQDSQGLHETLPVARQEDSVHRARAGNAAAGMTGEDSGTAEDGDDRPLMSIGWLLAVEDTDTNRLQAYRLAAEELCNMLQGKFPQFHWQMPFITERRFPPHEVLTPLPLLELGVHEKLSRHWDYALVLVPNELVPQSRIFTLGIPSSALEVAVISTTRLLPGDHSPDQGMTEEEMPAFIKALAALALHLLGHVWGLEHEGEGPMVPPEQAIDLHPMPFPAHQHAAIAERLAEVADARLEEQPQRWRLLPFYWKTFWADPHGIWTDVIGYKPWRLPFRMGRLTAAAAVSIVFLLLGAESWEVGTNQTVYNLIIGMWLAVLGTTLFLFWGQNLGEFARGAGWREQLIRTRIVVFFTLWIGMLALWVVLFCVSFLAASAVPTNVPTGWLGTPPHTPLLLRQAAFMATLGVLGGALGGNLEDEDVVKAQLFYDEET